MELSVTDSFFFFSLFVQMSFPRLLWPIYYALVLLSLEEVTVHAGHKVMVEADDNSDLFGGTHKGILGKQFRHNPILEIYITQ